MNSETAEGNCHGWAARDPSGVLSPCTFTRRALGSDDVSIKITHRGVCYGDVVWTRNKHGDALYPVVPGHEIVGIVLAVGLNVQRLKVGDPVGVGTCVKSCRDCEFCNGGRDVYCQKGITYTFNGIDVDGTVTKGGYSTFTVVHNRIPDKYPPASAAPLLCAGITVYSPMMHHKMNQPGKSLGVVGLGGLVHMAVKFGKAFGLKVTVFSTSISKKEEALSLSWCRQFCCLIGPRPDEIDAASGDHSFDLFMSLLKNTGVLALVGFSSEIRLNPSSLRMGMKTISGSIVGGPKEIQEMLDFCAAKEIYPNIEVIPIQYANEALERLIKKDVKYRCMSFPVYNIVPREKGGKSDSRRKLEPKIRFEEQHSTAVPSAYTNTYGLTQARYLKSSAL
ncbi:Alcohol dehydrogenase superfamily, zinc-type [Parasponia andersonii]|uniref:Alcohol dehydrogenase superfamily, zinc-type n=1 Tax=Parasponia andersonii TaxID=3476 RepID=A0A2P5AVW1_PARAD|nr:Alcohol dehydrogenase superfamily, zinc-type [Parasponia andersonii]